MSFVTEIMQTTIPHKSPKKYARISTKRKYIEIEDKENSLNISTSEHLQCKRIKDMKSQPHTFSTIEDSGQLCDELFNEIVDEILYR